MPRDAVEKVTVRNEALLVMATRIVEAYVGANQTPTADVPAMMRAVHAALVELASNGSPAAAEQRPAVSIKKSVGDDYIICLEDGAKLTMLKRYLRTHHNMTPEAYRKKWDLPYDYPMVAPAYARLRSAFAKQIGLGRIPVPRKRKK